MKIHPVARRWALGLGLLGLTLGLPTAAGATPTMDGEKDAEYTLVASSPLDNLLVDAAADPPINDNTDPRAKLLDVKDLYATNTGTDLYLYIELPYYDLNTVEAEWAVVFHLGGANDAIQRLGSPNDPYGASVDYGHVPALNAVLKSNAVGFKNDYDGNQGYAFLNPVNKAATDWSWDNGNFLAQTRVPDVPNNLIHGYGDTGGEIVYKGMKGIEVKIPFALFGINVGNTNVTAPKPGDLLKMQFYDNIRNRTSPNYPRGPIDCVPFEADSRIDPTRGMITTWADYTLKIPTSLEVSSLQLVSRTDISHVAVGFTTSVGTGATTATNYAVVDETTGAPVTVTSATVDPGNDARVILGLALPFSTKIRVTVSNVTSAGGSLISATKNTATLAVGAPVVFNLHDPWGDIARIGDDPATNQPYKITLTGDPIGWANDAEGASEIPMDAVTGETGHWRSPTVIVNPGLVGYKYRLPHLAANDNWNTLNPYDRRLVVKPTGTVQEVNDNAAGPLAGVVKAGPPVAITFTLVDLDNKVNGRQVYLTGEYNGWTADPLQCVQLNPVTGKTNTYSGTLTTPADFGQDITHKYKYLIIDPNSPDVDWNTLNPNTEWGGDHHIITHGTGDPLTQQVEDIVGNKPLRISRIASGLDRAPTLAGYWREIDLDVDGYITMVDALKALHQ